MSSCSNLEQPAWTFKELHPIVLYEAVGMCVKLCGNAPEGYVVSLDEKP